MAHSNQFWQILTILPPGTLLHAEDGKDTYLPRISRGYLCRTASAKSVIGVEKPQKIRIKVVFWATLAIPIEAACWHGNGSVLRPSCGDADKSGRGRAKGNKLGRNEDKREKSGTKDTRMARIGTRRDRPRQQLQITQDRFAALRCVLDFGFPYLILFRISIFGFQIPRLVIYGRAPAAAGGLAS